MDFDLLYPGRFLKSAKFKKGDRFVDVTLTIEKVFVEELEGDKGKKQKGIVAFVGKTLQLVLNRTNGEALKAMFGRETDNWHGKRVTLWAMPFTDSFTGEQTTAIRVRGSPDIAADKTFMLRLARKSPVAVKLLKTGAKTAAVPAAQSTPVSAAVPSAVPVPTPTPEPETVEDLADVPFVPPSPEEVAEAESLQAADGDF